MLWAQTTNAFPNLSHYPHGDFFDGMVAGHRPSSSVLVISECLGDDAGEHHYSVSASGRENDYRFVNTGGGTASGRGARSKQLSDEGLKDLLSAISGLPHENVLPSIDKLVLVSFHDANNWVTYSYDRSSPPKALQKIYEIISASKDADLAVENIANTKKLVTEARASVDKYPPISDVKTEDVTLKAAAIVVGNIRGLEGPRDAQFGQARYYGIVDVSQVLHGPVKPPTVISINAPLLASLDENGPNIYFLEEGNRFAITVGAQYTALKFLPATDANITLVRKLLPPVPDVK